MNVRVRPAESRDIEAMSRVLIASISQLCSADHHDDPATIATWTANKHPEGVGQMLRSSEGTLFVAERDGDVVAVGAITDDAVTLNYVDPTHRRTGVSSVLLAALERALQARGVGVARVRSTWTARDFYLSQGWIEDPPVPKGRFIQAFPMHKVLAG